MTLFRACWLVSRMPSAGLLHEVGNDERRLAGDGVVILYVQGLGGSKGNGNIFVSEEAFGLDGGDGVLLDNVVRRTLEIHQHGDFIGWFVRQLNTAHGAAMHATYTDIRAGVEADYGCELGLQSIGGGEEVLLAPDDEDSCRQNHQRCDNKSSKPCRPRHKCSL